MSEKIQAILLRSVKELKTLGWKTGPDWQITLKSDGHIPLTKSFPVKGTMGEKEWDDVVDVTIDFKIDSDDQLTHIPEFVVHANIFIDGAPSKDISYKMDNDTAFTERDFNNQSKILSAVKRIDQQVDTFIQEEYNEYVDANQSSLQYYNQIGNREDSDFSH